MIYKKMMLATILLVFMISSVSASDDININETLTIDDIEEISEVSLDEVISDSEDSFDVSYGASVNDSVSDTDSYKSYDDIRTLIDNANSGDLIELSGYYIGDNDDIGIFNSITIDGNGAVIDANGQYGRMSFCIRDGTFILKNIVFKNAVGDFGAALNSEGVTEIINCTFINCLGEFGGAIHCNNDCTIVNSTFIDCFTSDEGGAIRFDGYEDTPGNMNCNVINSTFINCFTEGRGGAIIFMHDGIHASVDDSLFINCSAKWDGGAIFGGTENSIYANNCIFINCSVSEADGIEEVISNVVHANCTFDGDIDISFDDYGDNSFIRPNEIITNPDDENYNPNAVIATIKDKSVKQVIMELTHRDNGGKIIIFNASIGEIPEDGYKIYLKDLDLTHVGDKSTITVICFDDNDNVEDDFITVYAVKQTDNSIQFFEIGDELTISFLSFYGNLTTGNLNDLDEMGWHPEGNFIQILNAHELDNVSVTVSGGNFKKTYTIADMIDKDNPDGNYIYSMGGYVYSLKLTDEIRNAIPENEIITFNYRYGNVNVTQKRIRHGDYMYKIITPYEVFLQFNITIADEQLDDLNDVAVNIRAAFDTNRQSIYMDFDGGCFRVYVNDVKVENLGRLVRVDHETELDLFRLCGHEDAWPNLNITLNDLGIESEGTYAIKVTHWPGGGSEFIPQVETEIISKEVTFSKTPQQVDSALTVTVNDINYGENALVVVRASEALSGNVSVQIENGIYAVNLKNGYGNTVVSNLNAGSYVARAIFNGNDAFLASEANATFNVNKLATALNATDVKTTYGTSKNIVVVLKDSNGKVLANKKVSVSLNGESYSADTDGDGKVSIKVPNNLAAKTYPATITFAGNTNYAKSTKSVNVKVTKATPKLTAKAKTFKKSVKTKKYTVTIKTNKNKVMKNTKLTLKVNGKTYSAKTNAKGQATFKITKLTKKGKFTAVVKYAGNKYYNAKTVKPKIIVK